MVESLKHEILAIFIQHKITVFSYYDPITDGSDTEEMYIYLYLLEPENL